MVRIPRPWRMHSLPLHLETLEARELLTLFGNPVFPADNPWSQRIDNAPVAANSATLVASIGLSATLKADFGAALWQGGLIGIPFNVVSAGQPKVPLIVDAYANESDLVSVPIPPGAVIEGDPRPGDENTGDRHLLVYDRDNNVLYEGFNVHRPGETPDGQWHADSLAFWNLNTNHFRPAGWTSADAAGLPILPGLVRPDEVLEKGRIEHPIRVTVPRSRNQYVFPASHHAGNNNAALPRMGERFRLRQDFDVSTFSATNQVILTAMKEYGLIVADNGSPWYMSGIPSILWNDGDLQNLRRVRGSDFEAVDLTPQLAALDPDTGPTTGGFQVTIDGLNFSGGAGQVQAFFGAVPAKDVIIKSDGQIVVTAPAHPPETVQVTVRTPYGNSTPTAAGLFTYADTGPQPGRLQFAATFVRANETDASALLTVLRTGGSDGPVSIRYATDGGTATAGADYTASSETLSFAAGETSKTFQIALRDDGTVEGRERVRLTLSNPTGGATLGTWRTATLLIRDNDGTQADRFVAQVYLDVLGRPAEPSGLVYWMTLLGQGSSPTQVVSAITGSPEYRANVVRDAYRQFLGRDPDPAGLAAWAGLLQNGVGEERLHAGLLGSDEFFARSGGTNQKYLESVYRLVLDREVDAAGAAGWDQVLRQGAARGAVAQAVLGSEERYRLEVEGLFGQYLGRPSDSAGLEGFVAALRQLVRRPALIAVMAGSEEYLAGCA